MGLRIGFDVEIVVIGAFVDAHTPEDDGGMIPVLQHHLPGVLNGLLLPVFVTDMLPAGDLRKHQQSQTVTLVDKMLALGIVGGPDDDTAQLLLQDPGILPL